MTKRVKILTVSLGMTLAVSVVWFETMTPDPASADGTYADAGRRPLIRPDYVDTVIPANISPLNFDIQEQGERYRVRIDSKQGEPIDLSSSDSSIDIPLVKWSQLLAANRGNPLSFEIFVMQEDDTWTRYETIVNQIATEDIDSHLVYRKLNPNYNFWSEIGIYQRDLSGWDESVVLDGRTMGTGCVNCHTFNQGNPDRMFIGIRGGSFDAGTLLADRTKVDKISSAWGYMSWHPSGLITTQTMIKVRQFFHRAGAEVRDVIDLDASMVYYDLRTETLKTTAGISEDDRLETYPTWSPDGRYLYFSSAAIPWDDRDRMVPDEYDEVRYDLRRISYDFSADEWGEVETVLSSDETGLSILMPRVSPDGRFLLFCMTDYGCFPILQPSSDLYMMDLKTHAYTRLSINSEYSESWHSWSRNSSWIAISSKRRGGLFTRTYISYVDDTGSVAKPFILPQRDPLFYDSHLKTFSVPEFTTGPVEISQRALSAAGRGDATIKVASPVMFDSTPTKGAMLTDAPVGQP